MKLLKRIVIPEGKFLFVPRKTGFNLFLPNDEKLPWLYIKSLEIDIPRGGKNKTGNDLKKFLFDWCDVRLEILVKQYAEKYKVDMNIWLKRTRKWVVEKRGDWNER